MAGRQTIAVSILADASGVRRGVGQANSSLGTIGGSAKRVGLALGAAFALAGVAVVGGVKAVVGAASNAQQSLGATETVFGKYADRVVTDSKRAAREVGLSGNAYRENANLIGSLFKNQGVSADQLAGKTRNMIGTASDLAATFGGPTSAAVEALGSAFKGEFDPLEKYGISIKQSAINAELAANGQDKLTGAALKQAQQQATTNLIMRQSKDSLGAFAREGDTLAHQQQVLGAQFDNIKVKVGTALLPILTRLAVFANDKLIPAMGKLGPVFQSIRTFLEPIITKIKEFADGGGQAGGKMDQLRQTVTSVWASIRSTFQSAVSIVTSLWGAFGGTIISVISSTVSNLMTILRGAFAIISGIFKVFSALLKGDWKGVWEGIKQILSGAWTAIRAIVSQSWAAIKAVFSIAGTALKAVFKGIWSGLKGLAIAGLNGIIDAVKALPGKVRALGGLLKSAGKSIIDAFVGGLKNAGGAIGGIAGSVWGALKKLLNGAITKINNALEFKIKIPGAPDIHFNPPNIPFLANGGYVTKPTLAVIGEAGPEYVIPANKMGGVEPLLLKRTTGSGNVFHVNVYVSDSMSQAEQGRKFAEAIEAAQGLGLVRV